MDNTMWSYLNKRMQQQSPNYQNSNTSSGPVICISREVGCKGVKFAQQLAAELEKQPGNKKWKVISKEILAESARELNMDPAKLQSILHNKDRSAFDDILNAFSEKRYKSDGKIRKTLIDLISSFANDGYCIIVGRAGHIIARDIEKSLLVRLTAPLEWRIQQTMKLNDLNEKEAIDFMTKIEAERLNLRKHIADDSAKHDTFDLTIDLSRMDIPATIDIIKLAAKSRGLL